MVLRALPYLLVWLDAVLLLVDVTPLRIGLAAAGATAAVATRLALTRPPWGVVWGLLAGGLTVSLLLTMSSTAGLARSLATSLFGAFGLYCAYRALRG